MFKSGAIRILKAGGNGYNVTRESHTAAIKGVEASKLNSRSQLQDRSRKRYLEFWLAESDEAVNNLLDLYNNSLPPLINNLEITAGLGRLSIITGRIKQALEPHIHRFTISKTQRSGLSASLRDVLFNSPKEGPQSYRALLLLQSLDLYLSHLSGLLTGLLPASAAIWEDEFHSAVAFSNTQVQRQLSWVKHQQQVISPQTLVVPT